MNKTLISFLTNVLDSGNLNSKLFFLLSFSDTSAFGCCANPKAGWNPFFSHFQPFVFFLNLFQWISVWNQEKQFKNVFFFLNVGTPNRGEPFFWSSSMIYISSISHVNTHILHCLFWLIFNLFKTFLVIF